MKEITTNEEPEPSQLEEESTGMDSFHEAATRANNTLTEHLGMVPKASVLQPLSSNKPIKKVVNPYKSKPYYVDNTHTFVAERDVRVGGYIPAPEPFYWPSKSSKKQLSLVIHAPKDPLLGSLGGADIDFGTSKDVTEKEDDAKKETGGTDTAKKETGGTKKVDV